ncbi:MAG: NAD(P)H-hydrate epimerase [Coriobacteriales bacterium]|jgi:hypoxanthine-DNA glycosylase|nr:NAD(P)H-hydrate epimerase [Coriobacteriales bacterium]
MDMYEVLTHPWWPIYDHDSRVLLLGTFPSPRSRSEGFYFGNPQNLFWTALADSLGVPRLPATASVADKTALLLDNHVALWDVLHSCRIEGAADASIRDPVPNRFSELIADSRVNTIFTTGRTATSLFNRLAASEAKMRAVYLPSSSPANRATQSRSDFSLLWGTLGRVVRGEVVSAAGMKVADRFTIDNRGIPSLMLMERAASAVVDTLVGAENDFDLGCVLCVCGTGNNGGDGLALARLLHQQGIRAEALLIGNLDHLSRECRQQLTWAQAAGVAVSFAGLEELAALANRGELIPTPKTIIDALFGIGLARPLTGAYRQAVEAINDMRSAGARVLAVDIPSGISADTGEVLGAAVYADSTLTFAYNKLGMLFEPGRSHAGKLVVADIGVRLPD